MKGGFDLIGEKGLEFFGTISASLTHEMKNSLAILTENTGLLEDLALMTEKGQPFDTERLKTLAGRIKKQIKRADGIVMKMNRFAHSIDEAEMRVDLIGILGFMATLVDRLAYMRGVTLQVKSSGTPVQAKTAPFLLETLIWRCLDRAMEAVGKGGTIELAAEPAGEGARIRIAGGRGWGRSEGDIFPSDVEKALLDTLEADLAVDLEAGELVLTLSGNGPS
jgi:signal transduction histidine kinase